MSIRREWYLEKLEMLSSAARVGTALYDELGNLLIKNDAGDGFCELICASRACQEKCAQFHVDAAREAYKLGEAYIARCPMGAVAIAAPIVEGDRLLGSALFQPVRMWPWDEEARAELMRALADTDITRVSAIQAGGRMPQIDPCRTKALMALLMDTVLPHPEDLEFRRLLGEQQRHIGEVIRQSKTGAGESLSAYPMHVEREMLNRVRIGDRTGARALLNELLGHIFYRAPGNMKLMKARVLELVVVISRAAVESGTEMEALLGLNYDFIAELSMVDDYETLCAWVVRMLETFLDTVSQTQEAPASVQLNDALNYIRAHHMESLTLDGVADSAHVSPYYLSHLFREKLGVTFVEYVTSVRMETAKNYLLHTRMPVSAIAEKLGYEDSGYFSKVFRKYTGMTPKAFRNAE